MGDGEVERTIFALLDRRAATATICPSEVARNLVGADGDWRALMPEVRRVAGRLVDERRLRVTRRGLPVDAEAPGGPVRLGRHEPDVPPGE